jgi:pyruvate dehydrogenase E2 component (dihydrolipoamide acetyltransferase)
MAEFRMPTLGADMEAGTLIEWLKRPGQVVHRGDIIAVVDTQKGAIEVEVFEDGVIEKTLLEPGAKVPVGTVLAIIGSDGGAAEAPQIDKSRATLPEAPPVAAAAPVALPAAEASRVRASPAARQAARRLSVDLATVQGTGPSGAITAADVERATAAAGAPGVAETPRTAAPTAPDRATAMRAAIAAAMTRSKREIPHFYVSTTIEMSRAEAWLASTNLERPVSERLLPVVLFLKAVARALPEVPELNGTFVDGAFRPGAGIHIGCAIALRGGGLVAPAIHDVDKKPVSAVMAELRDLVGRARSGSLRSSELSDPTMTVTNLGETGVESTFGIIFPPQVALVGFGRVVRRPWAVGDAVAVRPQVTVSLSADHRAVDGHRGGLFLAAVDRRLQEPENL